MVKEAFSYEKGIRELERLIELLGNEELPMEKAVSHYEKGIKLSRKLSQTLKKAEEKVEILSRDAKGETIFSDFEIDEGEREGE